MPSYYDDNTKKWYCKFYYKDYTGARKQKLKRGFLRQKDAKEYEREFLLKLQGTPNMSFQSLYELYIDDISNRLRQNSIDGKKNIFKNRILPYFKDKPINEISPVDIRAWQNEQIKLGYSDAYLDRLQNVMVTIMNYAVTYYNLPSNPCDRAGRMGKRTKSLAFWTMEEYNKVIACIANPSAKITIELLFYSGMRFGELLALTPKDISFDKGLIYITKSLQHKAAGDIITPPKTSNGVRTVSMPAAIMKELECYMNQLYELQDDDLIFRFTKQLIRGNMARTCKTSGVPLIRIHDLRHSHVSMLIELGFSPHLIAERIGDTVNMVNSTYGHLYPNKHVEVANRLDDMIKKVVST